LLSRPNSNGGIVSWNRFFVEFSNVILLAQQAEFPGGDVLPAEGPAGDNASNPLQSLIPMVFIGIIFYLIVMRPQLKAQKNKRKQHEHLMENLKKNDKVVTMGGIIGTVAEVSDDRVTLKIDDNTRVRFTRSSIQDLLADKTEADK